jgi:tetrapyrrole methylase family protein/MazG family protein
MSSEIIVVGMGPGPVKFLTQEATDILLAEKEIYFRVGDHPVYHWLRDQGKDCISFEPIYAQPGITYDKVYQTINKTLVKAAGQSGRVVYALPGNPVVFEKTPERLRAEAGDEVSIRIVAGLSFLEVIYQELEIDPEAGLQIINGFNFGYYGDYPFTEKLGLLIGQVGFPTENDPSAAETNNAGAIMNSLIKKFPPDHEVTLIWSTGLPDYRNEKRSFPLADLDKQSGFVRSLASLYVPPIKPPWEWVSKK